MPVRLLKEVPRDDDSAEFMLSYEKYMKPMDARLAAWLLDLLLIVVKYEATNLMDPKNCGKYLYTSIIIQSLIYHSIHSYCMGTWNGRFCTR